MALVPQGRARLTRIAALVLVACLVTLVGCNSGTPSPATPTPTLQAGPAGGATAPAVVKPLPTATGAPGAYPGAATPAQAYPAATP